MEVPGVGTLRLGTPVYMRNPDFSAEVESPARPRYCVGVVTALFRAPDSPVASHVEASWLRETSVGSTVYLGTDDSFVVSVENVAQVPGGLAYSRSDRSWRRSLRGPTDEVLSAAGTIVKVPRDLCYPGDEGEVGGDPEALHMSLQGLDPPPRPTLAATARQPNVRHGGEDDGPPPPRPTLAAMHGDASGSLYRPSSSGGAGDGAGRGVLPSVREFGLDAPPPPRPTLAAQHPTA